MKEDIRRKLRSWIFLRMRDSNKPEGWDAARVLRQDLSEEQLYQIAASVLLIDARNEKECGVLAGELFDLDLNPNKLFRAMTEVYNCMMEVSKDSP